MRIERLEKLQTVFDHWKSQAPSSAPALTVDGADVHGHFNAFTLGSVFQPLFSAQGLELKAHEALLRVRDPMNRQIAPPDAFANLSGSAEFIRFDRLCRVVHVLNFMGRPGQHDDLWLNVSADHLLSVQRDHGRVFETLLHYCGLAPSRIVLEILESRIDDLKHLQDAVNNYRKRGYRVALDDFGARHSNFDRLWSLTPDIVKLDRNMIVQGVENPRARRILPRLIGIIHELGAVAVCEGIETQDQLSLAQDSGADLVQGYFLGRPVASLWQRDDQME